MNNLELKLLTEEEINKNRVETINQYRILQYLKNNLNIYAFRVYLYSRDIIMVIDKLSVSAYFKYDEEKKMVLFLEKLWLTIIKCTTSVEILVFFKLEVYVI